MRSSVLYILARLCTSAGRSHTTHISIFITSIYLDISICLSGSAGPSSTFQHASINVSVYLSAVDLSICLSDGPGVI